MIPNEKGSNERQTSELRRRENHVAIAVKSIMRGSVVKENLFLYPSLQCTSFRIGYGVNQRLCWIFPAL